MTKQDRSGAGNTPAPLEQAYTLLSGRAVRLIMPDLFAMANGKADIPNQAQAEVYRLLYGDGETPSPAEQLLNDQRYMRSLFYTAQLVMCPRLKLDDEEEGEIDRRELALPDLMACFSFLRYGPPPPVPAAADRDARSGAGTGDALPAVSEQSAE